MDGITTYSSPIIYGLTILIWTLILIFFVKKIKYKQNINELTNLLLYILIINALNTISGNIYFGLRQSSHEGIIPFDIFNLLSKPQNVFLPKLITFITGIIIFIIVFYKWIPTEIKQKTAINKLIEKKNSELLKKNKDLLKAKEKAEESDKLKSEFLNNISHEIRTPMNAIIGFSELLESPDISYSTRKQYTSIIKNSSNQLLSIIDDILEISNLNTKQEKVKESQFYLNDLLMELYSIFKLKFEKSNILFTIKKGLSDNDSQIFTDKTKLNKIVSNLLQNAFRYTNEGFIELGYYITKNILVIYVKDSGIGILSENLESIFDRFTQEEKEISIKYGGLGLGLSISKGNAKLLGGDISVESEKGKGSTFYISIPYKKS